MSWVVTVVEDDDAIREHLVEVMTARGLKVVEARNGAEVLDVIRSQGVRPSMMVLDLMMPVMDGWTLLSTQASEPLLDGVPVIVITAHEPPGHLPETVRAVFRKPFPLWALLDTVRHLCGDVAPPRRAARGSDGLKPPLTPPGEDPET